MTWSSVEVILTLAFAARRLRRTAFRNREVAPCDALPSALHSGSGSKRFSKTIARPNITTALRSDAAALSGSSWNEESASRGAFEDRDELNVVELFAGAGGMGLGFLQAQDGARRFRISSSAEVDEYSLETLSRNHRTFEGLSADRKGVVPRFHSAIDLREQGALRLLLGESRRRGAVDVVIGGPPCQGFSSANRSTRVPTNPQNQFVELFVSYVEELRPLIAVLENVQGALWMRDHKSGSPVLDAARNRLELAGFATYQRLLDASWFGVPQYRNRLFLIGIHRRLGYRPQDFGDWGPFPIPTHGPGLSQPTTVLDAIGDLPEISNGADEAILPYRCLSAQGTSGGWYLQEMRRDATPDVLTDHIASKHAAYVVERFREVPPGGNWRSITHLLSNYSNTLGTHSNIYRRLAWDKPSVTLGHFRKSMMIHPKQHRGLSLREAARIQSFPDWFRFGRGDSTDQISRQQQQLANAVSPLLTRAVAQRLLAL